MGENTDDLPTQGVSLEITHGDSRVFIFKINCLLDACRVICFENLRFCIPHPSTRNNTGQGDFNLDFKGRY